MTHIRWSGLVSLSLTLVACTSAPALDARSDSFERRDGDSTLRLAGRVDWTDTQAEINLYFTESAPVGEAVRMPLDPLAQGSLGVTRFVDGYWNSPPLWTTWATPSVTTGDTPPHVPETTVSGAATGLLTNRVGSQGGEDPYCTYARCRWANLTGTVPRTDGAVLTLSAVQTTLADLPDTPIAVPVEPPEILEPFSVGPDAVQWVNHDLRIRWSDGPGIVVVCADTRATTGVPAPNRWFCQASEPGETTMVFAGDWYDYFPDWNNLSETKTLTVTRVVEGTGDIVPGVANDIASTATTTLLIERKRSLVF